MQTKKNLEINNVIKECFLTFPGYRSKKQQKRWKFFVSAHFGKWNYLNLTYDEKNQLLIYLYNKLRFDRCCESHNVFRDEMDRERRRMQWNKDVKELRILIQSGKAECANCGSKKHLTIDHIVPIAKGGKTEKGNLQILCDVCNQEKGDILPDGKEAIPFKKQFITK